MSQNSSLTEASETAAFVAMAREFPVRTLIFTFGLPAFALLQFVNAYLFEGSLVVIGGFGAMMVLCSIVLTRYHIAAYRREKVERNVAVQG